MNSNYNIREIFSSLVESNRIPHAVLIEGGDENARKEAVKFLSQYAVCKSNPRPCGVCPACKKAENFTHSDIYTPALSGKTQSIGINAIRDLIKDASIIPNEADNKVFILYDVDKKMSEIVQNAFLKILEEPPLSSLFILTAENSKSLLQTILSRVQVFSLRNENTVNEEIESLAKEIINGILSPSELSLLYATAKLTDRANFKETLKAVSEYLRMGLNKSVGVDTDNDIATALAKKLTKSRIINLIELTSKALIKADRNVNMTLLTTWLCGEYRRISWQR